MEKYTIGLYEKAMPGTLSWQEKLEAAKKAGFDYIVNQHLSCNGNANSFYVFEWTQKISHRQQ